MCAMRAMFRNLVCINIAHTVGMPIADSYRSFTLKYEFGFRYIVVRVLA